MCLTHAACACAEVTYDDEAVRKMLDRSQAGEKQVEKSFGLNEYLRSFKVATYKVKDVDEKEVRVCLTALPTVLELLIGPHCVDSIFT